MYYLIVLLLFLNPQIGTPGARCSQAGPSPVHHGSESSSLNQPTAPALPSQPTRSNQHRQISSNATMIANATSVDTVFLNHVDSGVDNFNDNEMDSLRLEYYKYKILSHLDITSDPDTINPELSEELRNKIKSTIRSRNIESRSKSAINSRPKRSLSCSEVKSDKSACCLETFYVNFTEVGWDKWILYPTGYNANYCRGQCDLSHARYYHSTLLSKFSSMIGLCCSPRQMAPLSLLYIDDNNKVLQKSVPDMIVEACDCA